MASVIAVWWSAEAIGLEDSTLCTLGDEPVAIREDTILCDEVVVTVE